MALGDALPLPHLFASVYSDALAVSPILQSVPELPQLHLAQGYEVRDWRVNYSPSDWLAVEVATRRMLRRGQDWLRESQRRHRAKVTTRMQELKRFNE